MELFTAKVKIIGNYGGTTVVMIRIHLKNNLFLFLCSFYNPLFNTYAAVIKEQISKNRITNNPSFCLMFMLLVLDITLRIKDPFEVSNPVLKTRAKHPLLTGGFDFSGI